MRVRRDINSIPHRSATETWRQIIALITGTDSRDSQQLQVAGGVMASLITDEHPAAQPIVLEGVGPQLRIYCRYGMKAIEEGREVDALGWNPTAGDWTMHIPCASEDMEWITASLAKTSPRMRVFDVTEAERAEVAEDSATGNASGLVVVDWNLKG